MGASLPLHTMARKSDSCLPQNAWFYAIMAGLLFVVYIMFLQPNAPVPTGSAVCERKGWDWGNPRQCHQNGSEFDRLAGKIAYEKLLKNYRDRPQTPFP